MKPFDTSAKMAAYFTQLSLGYLLGFKRWTFCIWGNEQLLFRFQLQDQDGFIGNQGKSLKRGDGMFKTSAKLFAQKIIGNR